MRGLGHGDDVSGEWEWWRWAFVGGDPHPNPLPEGEGIRAAGSQGADGIRSKGGRVERGSVKGDQRTGRIKAEETEAGAPMHYPTTSLFPRYAPTSALSNDFVIPAPCADLGTVQLRRSSRTVR